jgi:nucleoside-diphosphate-sugar epimerase
MNMDANTSLRALGERTVMVTGANDMIGLHVLTALKRLGAQVVGIGDLHSDLGSLQYLENEIQRFRPDLIFYIPAERHGIAVHRDFPGTVYYESLVVFAHLMDAARRAGVTKVVNVLSNCVYPEHIPIPHREADVWNGLPEATLIPHGMGRRMSLVHGAAYRAQYGLSTISLILASVYGSHDNFDPGSAQVMASMIRRFVDAHARGERTVTCWGTGEPTREFIHVRDAVRGVLNAALHYDDDLPLNIGTQQEISIRDLTEAIARVVGYEGAVEWDTSKPDGRPRVCLDSSRMRELLPAWDLVPLERGVRETVDWLTAGGLGTDLNG